MVIALIELLNMDCMEYMKGCEDNAFDLAIVDPPYGINIGASVGGAKPFGSKGHCRGGVVIKPKVYRGFDDSRIPDQKYFNELKRVSKNQIIWGSNYFAEHLPNSSCWVVWDKDNSGNFADCELAYTSFKTAVRKFQFKWNGMLQGDMKNKEVRIHPTQKPVKLYQWLLDNYAKPTDRILDTHLGSGSSAIAAHYYGCDFVGMEIDKDYYDAAVERFNNETKQVDMFSMQGETA